jgi:hypothetical protein
MFDVNASQWTWLNGSDQTAQVGSYGSQTVASASNNPGARDGHTMVFSSSMSAVYLFGGFGHAKTAATGKSIELRFID